DQKRAAEAEKAQIKKEKEEANETARLALASQSAELGAVKTRLQAMEEAELHRVEKERDEEAKREKSAALSCYLRWLVVVSALSGVGAWQAAKLFPWYAKILGSLPTSALVAIITFVVCHLVLEFTVCRRPGISSLWPFLQVKRFSRLLWAIVILSFVVGVGGSIYANWIQKNIDADKGISPAAEDKVPEPTATK
ncbi:MAG TPA: hypothetical protein VMS31_22870, partial [Pyrinomonadaceae bacterium]|nr:hypothetical protein [Pyrinomonadaceae bacterium]